jgi:hypothetical protein
MVVAAFVLAIPVILGVLVLCVVMLRASEDQRRRGGGKAESPTMRWITSGIAGKQQQPPRRR